MHLQEKLRFLWHITHRCNKKEHLLKFVKDKKTWRNWLFNAKKRYDLKVITYAVTCNHIHLLAVDSSSDVISKSMQLVSGATGKSYNSRKNRKGAFWEDRFYTTAIENGIHLLRCMAYIELNMVRAGAVAHPEEWEFCGYNEILDPPARYQLIDQKSVLTSCGIPDPDEFRAFYKELIAYTLKYGSLKRESIWTHSMAVGSRQFIERNQDKFGKSYKITAVPAQPPFKVKHPCQVRVKNDSGAGGSDDPQDFVIRESRAAYNSDDTAESCVLSGENTVFWANDS